MQPLSFKKKERVFILLKPFFLREVCQGSLHVCLNKRKKIIHADLLLGIFLLVPPNIFQERLVPLFKVWWDVSWTLSNGVL